jgi:hypothetical protein
LAQWIISPSGALIGTPTTEEQAMPELAVSREKISFLIEKAQEFDVKDLPRMRNPDRILLTMLKSTYCRTMAATLSLPSWRASSEP